MLALAAAPLLYLLAGLIGGMVPANRNWRPAPEGVRIYVEDNGVHTGIVVPMVAAGIDWRGLLRAEDLADPRRARLSHVAIGWGDRDFYLNTPRWADVRPGTLLHAAIGSGATVLHVEHIPEPGPGKDTRAIVLRPGEYRRLAGFLRQSFAPGAASRHGYAAHDAFYPARGRYNAFHTCNAWTGDALRDAGVRVGIWTPFPNGVMRWF